MFGDLLRSELSRRAIEHILLVRIADLKSPSPVSSSMIMVIGRSLIIGRWVTPPAVAGTREALDNRELTVLATLDAVLVDTRWEAAAIQVLAYARRIDVPAVIDAEAPVSHAAMALATHIAFSRQGLRNYASLDNVQQGLHMAQRQFGC